MFKLKAKYERGATANNSVKEIIDKRKKIDIAPKQMNIPLLIGSHAVYIFRIFGITIFPEFNLYWLLH
jgi:hypothetical protein